MKLLKIVAIILFSFIFIFCEKNQNQNIPNRNNQPDDFILEMGYLEYPPLTFTNSEGKPDGHFINIAKKTLERAKIKYRIVSYPARRLYHNLAIGKTHIFLGIKTTPQLQGNTITGTSVIGNLAMRVYTIGNKKPIRVKQDLKGKTVIILRGFSYSTWGKWIRDRRNGVNFFETNSHEAAFGMLKRGRADYLLNYKYIARVVINKMKIKNLKHHTLEKWKCYFNLSKKVPNVKKILNKIEISYNQLLKEGKLKRVK